IVPIPAAQLPSGGMVGEENARSSAGCPLGLLKHSELIGGHRAIGVNAPLDVPAGKVTPERAGERACPKSTHGRTLPETIINMSGIKSSFLGAAVLKGLPDGAFPSRVGDFLTPCSWRADAKDETKRSRST